MIFDEMFEYVIKWEGERYVNDPDDAGGETKYGITKRSFPRVDIEKLDKNQAKEIYRDFFYEPNKKIFDIVCHFDKTQELCIKQLKIELFDAMVNLGIQSASKLFQRSLNVFSSVQLEVDGFIGHQTKMFWQSLIKEYLSQALLYVFREARAGYYRLIISKSPSQKKFLRGWLRRAYADYRLF